MKPSRSNKFWFKYYTIFFFKHTFNYSYLLNFFFPFKNLFCWLNWVALLRLEAWNYFVPIIRAADSSIDFYQVQAYNNWYGGLPPGSFNYIKEVYLHWRNLPGTIPWSSVIPDFSGVNPNKLLMGVLASTSAGVSSYYAPPNVIKEFKNWLKVNNYPMKGFMMWDSNWDRLNNYQVSNAITDPFVWFRMKVWYYESFIIYFIQK